jgi:hypothetical protein
LIWTDQADALLIRLWDEGGSLGYVARGMQEEGYVVTRNAVAGRKHRLKITNFNRQTLPIKTLKPRIIQPINQPRRRTRMTQKPAPKTDAELLDELSQWEGVDYLSLKPNGCKAIMPTRGGDWMLQRVCGKLRGYDASGNRSSYCPAHIRLYCNPNSPRRAYGQGSQVTTS